MIRKPFKIGILVFVSLLLIGEVWHLENKFLSYKKKTHRKLKKYKHTSDRSSAFLLRYFQDELSLPKELTNLPLSDREIVLDVKKLDIRNVFAPYNASLIEKDDGYFLFFRYDQVRQMHMNMFHTYIGCAELDKKFRQTDKEFVPIRTNSDYSEDPRVIRKGDELLLIYNDLLSKNLYSRSMHVASIDPESGVATSVTNLDLRMKQMEKNWVPFIYEPEPGVESVHFEYQISNPRRILTFNETDPSDSVNFRLSKIQDAEGQSWKKKWGMIRGGSSARLVDGEYPGFFHSSFTDVNDTCWYVMGAYTFEAHPPFRVTAMSPHPILFKGIYDSPTVNTADLNKFVVFPGGFVIEKDENRTLLHLACGENDSATKIITMDKNALLQSLKKLDPQ